MESREVAMSLLLETLDRRTGDAGKSGVYKKVTELGSVADWVPRSIGVAATAAALQV